MSRLLRSLAFFLICAAAHPPRTGAQQSPVAAVPAGFGAAGEVARPNAPAPAADPLRLEAEQAGGLRILVSLGERRLWLRDGAITLHTAPVGIGKGTTLRHDGRSWTFATPRGRRQVRLKEPAPVWVPPDWHYVELAQQRGFRLARLSRGADATLRDGARLRIRGDLVVHVDAAGDESILPTDEEIVFDSTVFVPPVGTANRRIPGELGAYKLDLGDGYLLHGTRDAESVGGASTHGCFRLGAEDLELLFRGVPIGTPVYIF